MLPPVSGTILNLNTSLLTAGFAGLKTGRVSVWIKSNETSFQYGLDVRIHAVPEIIMQDLMDYSTIL